LPNETAWKARFTRLWRASEKPDAPIARSHISGCRSRWRHTGRSPYPAGPALPLSAASQVCMREPPAVSWQC